MYCSGGIVFSYGNAAKVSSLSSNLRDAVATHLLISEQFVCSPRINSLEKLILFNCRFSITGGRKRDAKIKVRFH